MTKINFHNCFYFSNASSQIQGVIHHTRYSMETPTLLVTPQPKRKFSFPVNTLHSSVLLGLGTGDVSIMSARRRLSNVSDAVSRKFSNTIGWKVAAVPAPDIITQGKCLCGQYVRGRLKRSGVYNKKIGLHRMRSFIGTSSIHVVRDVYPALNNVSTLRVSSNDDR